MIRSFDDALAGTGKTFVGVGTATTGEDAIDSMSAQNPRFDVSNAVHDMTARNIRSILVAVSPCRSQPKRSDRIRAIPVARVAADAALDHFGPFAHVMALDFPPMISAATRTMLAWQPTHPGLIADLEDGHYFETS